MFTLLLIAITVFVIIKAGPVIQPSTIWKLASDICSILSKICTVASTVFYHLANLCISGANNARRRPRK